ncbi:hypothetical protein [Mesorhizobium sp. CAU 1741]|uniref:hypothetical protein n=1 Tax=Mesorhizobium sp. CAU 1741 TaxID=3140366 RepID=UPI00325A57F9
MKPSLKSLAAGLLASWVLLSSIPVGAQEAVEVPGTTVTLTPPAGFTPAEGFAGFVDDETEASILIVELPAAAHAQLAPLFGELRLAQAAFASQGVAVASLTDVAGADDATVPVLAGTQSAGGVTFDKWIALYSGEMTVMLTIQAPQGETLGREQVEQTIASVTLGPRPTLDEKIAALPFEIAATAPFRVIDTIAGSGVLMTAGARDVDPDGRQPVIVVAQQVAGPVSPDALEEVAETLLSETQGLTGIEIEDRERMVFAGHDGILLHGTARDNERIKRFSQYLSFADEGRSVRLVAIADDYQFEEVSAAIEAVAASVIFKN